MESFVKYLRQLSSIFRICEYTFKDINFFFLCQNNEIQSSE